MARADAYATLAEYRAANRDGQSGADTTISNLLTGTSRLLERDLSLQEGAFNSYTGTHYFGANGGAILNLEDTDGYTYFLQTIAANGCGIDSELDGTYDGFALDLADAFLIGQPENTASKPFTQLRLMSWASATVTVWPVAPRSVKINGTWGHAAVPDVVKHLTIRLTRLMLDSHLGGGAQVIPAIDDLIRLPDAPKEVRGIWYSVKQLYGRRLFATTVSI
ncbi:MAG: hypothetical protein WAY02_09400 [Burkholderiaceae bacterium]